VTPKAPSRCRQQLETLEARTASNQIWRAQKDAPQAIVTALATPPSEDVPAISRPRPTPVYVADAAGGGSWPMIVRLPRLPTFSTPKVEDLIALIRVAPTAEAIEAARAAIEDQVGKVTFAETIDPLPADSSEAQPTIDSMFWWSATPAHWARWASIPVVIEQ
jgi:hypothetical protein